MGKRWCPKFFVNLTFIKLVCILLVLLTLIQMLFVLKLTQPNGYHELFEKLPWRNHRGIARNATSLLKKCINKIQTVHIMDLTGMYYVVPNFIQATHKNQTGISSSVTICTHTTPNHLHNLVDLAKIWKGPISVSVFTHRHNIDSAVKTIINLHLCNKLVRKYVSFHMIFTIQNAKTDFENFHETPTNCDNLLVNDYEDNTNYDSKGGPYPSNILRNIAIENTQTRFITVLDIDLVPSENLHNQFQHFIQRQNRNAKSIIEKTGFVLPCFESKSTKTQIMNKGTLKQHMTEGSIRPFYIKACEICQIDTDFSRWLEFPSMGFLETAYEVEWVMSWEPFFIADKTQLPLYDSRFKQYGYNRVSQICESFLRGFRFLVLNNGFLVHRGFKDSDSFHANKSEEHKNNRKLFNIFRIEMKERYPDAGREC